MCCISSREISFGEIKPIYSFFSISYAFINIFSIFIFNRFNLFHCITFLSPCQRINDSLFIFVNFAYY